MLRRLSGVLVALLMLMPTAAHADVPGLLNLQGHLSNADGQPVNGTYAITFSLYESEIAESAIWTTTVPTVTVVDGLLDEDLGLVAPIPASIFLTYPQLWMGITVEDGPGVTIGGEAELPRRPLTTVAYAFQAAHADVATTATQSLDLDCTGCVAADELDFAAVDTDTLNTALGTLQADLLSAISGTCAPGEAVVGINVDGSPNCASVNDSLPADGIDEISNNLIHNQFIDTWASQTTPVPIPDNNPTGVADSLVVPDAGIAQNLTVSIELTNSDLATIEVRLFDPNNVQYILYDKDGPGTELQATYPDPTPALVGDLGAWVGQNPQGIWRLVVVDTGFLNNTTDGVLVGWSIEVQTLSTKKIQVKGDLYVDGNVFIGGEGFLSGMVTPFDRDTCPSGWSAADGGDGRPDLRGRFAIGAGPKTLDATQVLARGDVGGSHRWRTRMYYSGSAECCNYNIGTSVGFEWQGESSVSAGNAWSAFQDHLPPFYALLYCVKD